MGEEPRGEKRESHKDGRFSIQACAVKCISSHSTCWGVL